MSATAQIPRDVFTPTFQMAPDFDRILHTANQSPYLVSMLSELHARGGRVDLTDGNKAFYRISEDRIYIGLERLPEPDEQGRIYPGASRHFATMLAHEAGHATVQRRDVVAKNPWQAGVIGLAGEGVAFRSEYIVARQLEQANPGEHVLLFSDAWSESARAKLDALARTSGVDSRFADRTKDTRGPAWDTFDKQAQQIGTEHYRYLHPSTMPGLVYNESYAEKWALLNAKSAIPTERIDAMRLQSDHVKVIPNPDNGWRLVGKNIPTKQPDGEVMSFDIRFNAKGVIQGKPQLMVKSTHQATSAHAFADLMDEPAAGPRRPAAPIAPTPTPPIAPELRTTTEQIRQELQPRLQGHFNAEQIESLSAAAAVHGQRNAHLGPVSAMLLSRDQQTLAFRHEPMQLSEMSVPAALEKSAAEHLQQASRDQTNARDSSAAQLGAPATPAAPAPRAM